VRMVTGDLNLDTIVIPNQLEISTRERKKIGIFFLRKSAIV